MPWIKEIAILAPEVVRIVCRPDEAAAVRPTLAVPRPERFRAAPTLRHGRRYTYQHDSFSIRIRQDGRPLDAGNLEIVWLRDGQARRWRPGQMDRENLGGPFPSLDLYSDQLPVTEPSAYDPLKGFNAQMIGPLDLKEALRRALRKPLRRRTVDHEAFSEFRRLIEGRRPQYLPCWPREVLKTLRRLRHTPPGLLSRSGMTLFLDDSLPWNDAHDWIEPRADRRPQIFYAVYYDGDFKRGLGLLADLLGPIPLIPPWLLGTWFSCYRTMGERSYHQLADGFRRHDLPLDVVVVDTDWHREYWYGFDWNRRLFPDPRRFARWLRQRGLHAVYNVHPGFVPQRDRRLPDFLRRTGQTARILDEQTAPSHFEIGCHPVDFFDRREARAYLDIFHRPIEREGGCGLWWVDGTLQDAHGREATAWLNELYCRTDDSTGRSSAGTNDRVVLSRAGGLGVHRSTIHFTGDTYSQWAVLEQEVRTTPLAANTLLAYVSHDIGGFYPGDESWPRNQPPDDLMARWVQFGCLSPVMRLHSDHGIREPWRFGPRALSIIRRFLHFRRALRPYLRFLVEEAHATGVGLCRPMYYEFPDRPEAFEAPLQYMLGPALLVAPVTKPSGQVDIWLPPGPWRHGFLDRQYQGPARIRENVPLDIAPVYARLGGKLDIHPPKGWNAPSVQFRKRPTSPR
ncbi:MAG: hypothetical protein GXY44_03550 [Phycisphaerales bacterium]|nr:hypothetical protein [Phycisphaerales bacterium]